MLQRPDVPAYAQFAEGAQVGADAHAGPRKDAARFGRLGGWIARYRPVDPGLRSGPLVIESRADLFPSSSAAKQDLDAYGAEYDAQVARSGGRRLAAPTIGDEALAFTFGGGADVFYLVAWRLANASASVLIEGSAVRLDDALALARTQAERIAAAAH